jgi:hypothetical protein
MPRRSMLHATRRATFKAYYSRPWSITSCHNDDRSKTLARTPLTHLHSTTDWAPPSYPYHPSLSFLSHLCRDGFPPKTFKCWGKDNRMTLS